MDDERPKHDAQITAMFGKAIFYIIGFVAFAGLLIADAKLALAVFCIVWAMKEEHL